MGIPCSDGSRARFDHPDAAGGIFLKVDTNIAAEVPMAGASFLQFKE
jgi:hypothetical protein